MYSAYGKQRTVATGSPAPGAAGPVNQVKGPTWGDSLRVTRRIRIEPCLIPQVLVSRQGDTHGVNVDDYITGELLHERYGRGNLHCWDASTGERLTNIHPFAGVNETPTPHGATHYLKLDAPRREDVEFLA